MNICEFQLLRREESCVWADINLGEVRLAYYIENLNEPMSEPAYLLTTVVGSDFRDVFDDLVFYLSEKRDVLGEPIKLGEPAPLPKGEAREYFIDRVLADATLPTYVLDTLGGYTTPGSLHLRKEAA